MNSIDPIYISTTLIDRFYNDTLKGTATGFFFFDGTKLYLVTNKHVIYGEKFFTKETKPEVNLFKLLLHTNANDLRINESFDIPLVNGKSNIWLEHSNPEIDVVLVPVDIDRKKYAIAHVDNSSLESKDLVINFEKIFVMGYPYGWFDRKNNLPITRIGHLSSPFGVPFAGKPVMLGDVETHQGMSGGPVFMDLNDYVIIENGQKKRHLGTSKRLLAGIHSGQPRWDLIDNHTKQIKETVRHSLINIWFSSLIPEIISGPTIVPKVISPTDA